MTQKGDKRKSSARLRRGGAGGLPQRNQRMGEPAVKGTDCRSENRSLCYGEPAARHGRAGQPPPPSLTAQARPVSGQQLHTGASLYLGLQACNWGGRAAVPKSRMAGAQPLGTAVPLAFKEGGGGVGVRHILPRFRFLCWWKGDLRKLEFRGYCLRMKSILVLEQALY